MVENSTAGDAPETAGATAKRVALVTGGSGNLGRHVVQRLVMGGARVHVPAYDTEEIEPLEELLGEAAKSVRIHRGVDLRRGDEVEDLFRRVEGDEGRRPEILLNLAGGFAMAPVEDTGPEIWARMWELNATTAFLCSRTAFPSMKASRWGRIVNVAAFPAIDRGARDLSAYAAAKSAVMSLTHTLSREGFGHGVTANAVIPAIIDTPANRKAQPDADTSDWLPPAEIAGVIAFLVSDAARIVSGAGVTLHL